MSQSVSERVWPCSCIIKGGRLGLLYTRASKRLWVKKRAPFDPTGDLIREFNFRVYAEKNTITWSLELAQHADHPWVRATLEKIISLIVYLVMWASSSKFQTYGNMKVFCTDLRNGKGDRIRIVSDWSLGENIMFLVSDRSNMPADIFLGRCSYKIEPSQGRMKLLNNHSTGLPVRRRGIWRHRLTHSSLVNELSLNIEKSL